LADEFRNHLSGGLLMNELKVKRNLKKTVFEQWLKD